MADQDIEVVEQETADSTETVERESVGDDLRHVIETLEAETVEGHEEPQETEAGAPEETQEEVPAQEARDSEQPAPEPVKIKPPLDWSPTLKQSFKELPNEVQQAIHDREVAVNNVMQQTANDRRMAQEFNNVVGEFRGLMAAEGVQNPLQGVRGLLATTAQLAMGNKEAKANKIAQLIKHYNVDIETLDQALVGEAPQQQQPPADPRIDWMMNQMQQAQQAQQQQVVQGANQTIHEFAADPNNEFFDDVRMVMADFLDVSAKNGQHMSIQEAYDRACASNPEIAQIQAQRRAQQSGMNAEQHLQQKNNAAASISGKASGGSSAQPMEGGSIRDILETLTEGSGRI
jgi:hypothetical protein